MQAPFDLLKKPLQAGMPAVSPLGGGVGMQGFNGGLNDVIMGLLENNQAPGARRTTSTATLAPGMPNLAPGVGSAGTAITPKTTSPFDELLASIAKSSVASKSGSDPYGSQFGPVYQDLDTGLIHGWIGPEEPGIFFPEPPPEPPPEDTGDGEGDGEGDGGDGGGGPLVRPGPGTRVDDEPPPEEEDPYQISPEADMFAQMVYDILMGGAGMADYTSAFAPLREDMEGQVRRAQADTLEQFGTMGAQYGSGAISGVSEVGIRGAEDINTILGQLAYGADEANRQRMIQGALQLGNQLYGSQEGAANRELQLLMALLNQQTAGQGQLGSLGMFMQGVDQQALEAAYQEWLRTEMGWTDEMLAFLGTPMASSGPYYQSGAWDQMLPLFTSLLTSGVFGGSGGSGSTGAINWGNWFGPPTLP